MIKLSVISNPDFNDYNLIKHELLKEKIDVLVVGGRRGADMLAEEFAIEQELTLQVFLPEYRRYGEEAYHFQNRKIIENTTKVIIFWNRLSKVPVSRIPLIREYQKRYRTVMY